MVSIVILAALTALLAGCQRAPSAVDHFTRTTDLLDSYVHTNALGAEAAMLELEKYTCLCEKAGSTGIDYDRYYAAVYSRLYLVEKELGKEQAAAKYYQIAAQRWRKVDAKDRVPDPTDQRLHEQIEGVDRYFGKPSWRKEASKPL